jgi:hypothetical protein
MVDFAYVPTRKGDGFMLDAKGFLALRTPPVTFGRVGLGNLQAVLKWVDGEAQANRPSAIIIASHAWPHAMSVPLVPKQQGSSGYTKLVDLLGGGFALPARFKQAPSGGQPRTRLIIKGCRIGKSEPFLRVLKTLLGGEVEIRAAQHYEYFISMRKIFLDFLTYSYELHRKDPIGGHRTLVTEFTAPAADFQRYDGSAMPAAEIEAMLDQLIKRKPDDYLPDHSASKRKLKSNDPLVVRLSADLKFPAGSVLNFEKLMSSDLISKYRKFRFEAERRQWTLETVTGTSTVPSQADVKIRVERLRKDWEDKYGEVAVAGGGTVKKSYGEYLGLHPGEGLFDRIKWSAKKTTNGFDIVATYYRYELEIPITSIADGLLFFTGRKRKSSTQIDEQLNWPMPGQLFDALFRTV